MTTVRFDSNNIDSNNINAREETKTETPQTTTETPQTTTENTHLLSEIPLDEESIAQKAEIFMQTVKDWKCGGALGTICSTLAYSFGTAFAHFIHTNENHSKYIATVAAVFVPLGLAGCADLLRDRNNARFKWAIGSFALFGVITGTIDGVAASMYSMNAAYPSVVPISTFVALSILNCALPEACDPQSWKCLSKVSDSCFSLWNRHSWSRNSTDEVELNEVVNERRHSR